MQTNCRDSYLHPIQIAKRNQNYVQKELTILWQSKETVDHQRNVNHNSLESKTGCKRMDSMKSLKDKIIQACNRISPSNENRSMFEQVKPSVFINNKKTKPNISCMIKLCCSISFSSKRHKLF